MLRLNFNRFMAATVSAVVAFSLILGVGLLSPNSDVYADAQSEGFVITDYDVNVVVSEDRVYTITENITCDFSESKHGIYRCIPTTFNIERADGSKGKMNARVENFQSDTTWEENDEFTCSGFADRYYSVKLGDPDITVNGEQTYTISYDYMCSDDKLEDMDEFYFNIIGAGWDTDIEHVTFSVEMPKAFDNDNVGFSLGVFGTAGVHEGELMTAVDNKTVSGETLRSMAPGEALTVRIELPAGYFTENDQDSSHIWIYIIIAILTLISAFLCWKWGRDDKIVSVIQFNPPEGYNSLDVGVMDHLDARDADVLSLLVYLADKGYLTIEPIPDRHGNIEKSKNFYLHKVREYDGNNVCERVFMEGLFMGRTRVSTKELKNSFYKTIRDVKSYERGFSADLVCRKGRIPLTLMILVSAFLMVTPAFAYGGLTDYIFSLSGGALIWFLIGLGLLAIMVILWAKIQRRTPTGVELAGQARGFKEFLETAEKDRIEQMIEENPQSFYKVIPYAMALGVTDKWIKKFKGITMEPPRWFIYNNPVIEGYLIGSIIGSTLSSTMKSVSSAPASSGGGGHAGGGAGGGGGGSW